MEAATVAEKIEMVAIAVEVVASHPVGEGGEELAVVAEWEGTAAEIRTVAAMEKAQVVAAQSTTVTLQALIRIATHRLRRRATTPHTMAQHSSQQ